VEFFFFHFSQKSQDTDSRKNNKKRASTYASRPISESITRFASKGRGRSISTRLPCPSLRFAKPPSDTLPTTQMPGCGGPLVHTQTGCILPGCILGSFRVRFRACTGRTYREGRAPWHVARSRISIIAGIKSRGFLPRPRVPHPPLSSPPPPTVRFRSS